MPVYLAHGFRWPRDGFTGIRVHAIVHNLEEVSVEYVQNENSRLQLAESLRTLHPTIMQRLETAGRRIDFLEQYDPADVSSSAVTQPYAFVCDRIAMIAGGERAETHLGELFQTQAANASKAARERPLSTGQDASTNSSSPDRSKSPPQQRKARTKTLPMSIEQPFNSPPDIRALSANVHDITNDHPIPPDAWDALAELRDQLAKDEKIGWWVVYNGDPERAYDSSDEEYESEASDAGTETGESVEEGVKELRPKVAVGGLPDQPKPKDRSLPLRSGEDKPPTTQKAPPKTGTPVVTKAPAPLNTTNPPLSATNSPIRSPTGGRIPPPVPPPPPKSSARERSNSQNQITSQTASVPIDSVCLNKELPLSPVSEKEAMNRTPTMTTTRTRAISNGTPPPTGMRTANMTKTVSGNGSYNKGQVEQDPKMQIEKAGKESAGKKETLRRKFFGKRSGSQPQGQGSIGSPS